MPNRDPNVLEHLRALFRTELEEQIAVMIEQLALASNQDTPHAERRRAAEELYRAVHSLKGAAGAVAFPEPERICHQLEDKLADARRGQDEVDANQVQRAIVALRGWLQLQPRDSVPPSAELSHGTSAASLSSIPPASKPGEESSSLLNLQGTVRVRLEDLDVLLTTTNDWLVRLRTPDNCDEELTAALRSLASILAESSEHESPQASSRQLARRLLTTIEHRLREMKLRQRRWEEALLLHGSNVGRLVRSLRLHPVSQLMNALEHASNETAKSELKQVEFSVSGGEAKADHWVIERLREPLLQLVRNAVVHGIETPEERSLAGKAPQGKVAIHAQGHGTELSISVSDDGRGIQTQALKRLAVERGLEFGDSDAALLELVCAPGLSTRQRVDHQAGRGIGMDVVKDRIDRLQGRISLSSTAGAGTRIALEVPVDLSLIEVLLVLVGEELFALPSASVVQLMRVSNSELVTLEENLHVRYANELLRLSDFGAVLDSAHRTIQDDSVLACIILEAGGEKAAFVVDQLVSVSEYVVKPLNERARVPGARAAVVLGNGLLAPLLSAQALCSEATASPISWSRAEETTERQRRILIVDDSITTRQLVRIVLETAGYSVESEADGEKAWSRLRAGQRFDAVVTDVEMPILGGLELLARIRASARFRELPVILITALAQDEDKRRALDLGADAYVVKSRFEQQTLLDTLRELIE